MKVLFAIRDDNNIVDTIARKYQRDYGKKLVYKEVNDFSAILRELQQNNNYDRIIISDDIDSKINKSENKMKLILSKLKSIRDIAVKNDKKIPIIFLGNNKKMAKYLYDLNIYDGIIESDITKKKIYDLILKPRNKVQSKEYYGIKDVQKNNINTSLERSNEKENKKKKNVTTKASDNVEKKGESKEISEVEKAIKYLNQLNLPEEKYIKKFESICTKFNPQELQSIIKALSLRTKKILKNNSTNYNKLTTKESKIKEKSKDDELQENVVAKRGRGRPRKEKKDEEPAIKRKRGRPRKVLEQADNEKEIKKSELPKSERKNKKNGSQNYEDDINLRKDDISKKSKNKKKNDKKTNLDEDELDFNDFDLDEENNISTDKKQNRIKKANKKEEKAIDDDLDLDNEDEEIEDDILDLDEEDSNVEDDNLDIDKEDDEDIEDDDLDLDEDDEDIEDDDLDLDEDDDEDEDDEDIEDDDLDLDEDDEDIEDDDLDLDEDDEDIEDDDLDLDEDDDEDIEDDLDLDEDDDEDIEDDDLDLDEDDDEDIEDDDLDLDKDDDEDIEDDQDLDEDDDEDIEDDDLDLDEDDDEDIEDDDLDLDEDDEDIEDDDLDLDKDDDEDDEDIEDDDLDLDEDDEDIEDDDLDLDEDDEDDIEDNDLDLDEDDEDIEDNDLDLDEDDEDIEDDDLDSDEDDEDIEDDDLDLDEDDKDIEDDTSKSDEEDTENDTLDLYEDEDKYTKDDDLDLNEKDNESDVIDLDEKIETDEDIGNINNGDVTQNNDFNLEDDDISNLDDDFDYEEDNDNDLIDLDDDDLKIDDSQTNLTNNGQGQFSGIKNKNYNPNYDISRQINEINGDVDNKNITNVKKINLSNGKKIVAFVGAHGNGTSFIVNNMAQLLSEQGIKTSILDLTKNRNSYYTYIDELEEGLRNTAYSCFEKLKSGIPDGIKVNKYLTVYTALPGSDVDIEDKEGTINTILSDSSLVLLDCDLETDLDYFEIAQEIYLVQSVDVLTIQPLTAFLKKAKMKKKLDESKLRILINKYLRVKKMTVEKLIGAMSIYNSPDMTYQLELFNGNKIEYLTIPFEEENYAKYLTELIMCKITIRGYSKNLINSFNKLAKMIYPINGKNK